MDKTQNNLEEIIMQFAKELIAIRDTENTAWLLDEAGKAGKKLAHEINSQIKQSNESNSLDQAIQQITGMVYSEGKNVQEVIIAMGLSIEEWQEIKEQSEWIPKYYVEEIDSIIEQYKSKESEKQTTAEEGER